jgi:hypothetical protein
VQRFVERQQVSLKWITQGLSKSGRMRSKLSLSSNPAITIQKVSCVPNTPNTLVRCLDALVQQNDSEIQVVVMIISNKCNLKINIAASKHVTKRKVNGVQCLETRPRDHTFTNGHTPNKYNIIELIDTNFNMQLKTILQWKMNTNHA